jgi:hypothetical protein
MKTVQIKSSDPESQGPFVVINEEDFDAEKHELLVDGEAAPAPKAKSKSKSAE